VPGGAYLIDVAGEALKRLKERRQADRLRQEVLAAAQAGFDDARIAAEQVVEEVVPPGCPIEDRIAFELFLTQIPGAVRQSLKRPDDPTGKTVPPGFDLTSAGDLLKRLPTRPAKFRPGSLLPGRDDWELVELLGVGGFGEVWLARNAHSPGLRRAVKFGLDPAARDRLLKHEKSVIEQVQRAGRHPHVTELVDVRLTG